MKDNSESEGGTAQAGEWREVTPSPPVCLQAPSSALVLILTAKAHLSIRLITLGTPPLYIACLVGEKLRGRSHHLIKGLVW